MVTSFGGQLVVLLLTPLFLMCRPPMQMREDALSGKEVRDDNQKPHRKRAMSMTEKEHTIKRREAALIHADRHQMDGGCHPEFCVMAYSEHPLNSVQA
jgi:hypothetical protein